MPRQEQRDSECIYRKVSLGYSHCGFIILYFIMYTHAYVYIYKCTRTLPIYKHSSPASTVYISVRSRLSRHSSHSSQVQTLPCLPPVMRSHLDKKEFSFPTLADIKHSQKLQDAVVVEHSSSNPTCYCAMCMLHESATACENNRVRAGMQYYVQNWTNI